MNIIEILDRYPSLFYSQSWYRGEAFTRMLPVGPISFAPSGVHFVGQVPPPNAKLRHAVDLIACFLKYPSDPIWNDYLWTADKDANGQRVYIGGMANGKGFELHRHIHLTERFGTPSWS